DAVPPKLADPATKSCLLMPTPPDTTSAPVLALAALAVFWTVTTPATFSAPPNHPLLAIPMPPETTRAPVLVLEASVELVIWTVGAVRVPDTFAAAAKVHTPLTVRSLAMLTFLATPMPPAHTNAPFVELVDSVTLLARTRPSTLAPEYTFRVLLMAAPPDTTKAPELADVESAVELMATVPDDSSDPTDACAVTEAEPVTPRLPCTLTFLATPRPPETTRDPVDELVDSKVELRIKAPRNCTDPLKTLLPVTARIPPMLVFLATPSPPEITSAPDPELVDSVVAATAKEFTDKDPANKVVAVSVCPTVTLLPNHADLATPIPPATTSAPEPVPAESAVALTVRPWTELELETVRDPPTLRFRPTPIPPLTTRAPVLGLDASVREKTWVCEATDRLLPMVTAPPSDVVEATAKLPPTLTLRITPMPPATTRAPDVTLLESVVLLTVTIPCA
ncbi:hypothetical protein HK102_009567, partial [Quaeritorhiza haematococci]